MSAPSKGENEKKMYMHSYISLQALERQLHKYFYESYK